MNTNLILNADSYKVSHWLQYPPNTSKIYSYIEARGSKDPSVTKTVFFGLQMFIKEYLLKPITLEDIEEAAEIYAMHGEPFNYDGWMYILNEHNGYLPIEIEAVKEGSVVELQNVLVQVSNTDPNVSWLTSYVETMLLRAIWYPVTVSTNSYYIKQDLMEFARKSGTENVDFKLHDFGSRGVSSNESAMIGGLSHLVNFRGTDTVAALVGGYKYYHVYPAGYSIPAAEHSTITVWGKDSEVDAYRNMLTQFAKPNSMLAVVSDSYDIYNAADKLWGDELKQDILDSGATVVIRPDSGDPTTVPIEVIEILMKRFGYSVNEKGYKVLPSCVRVIQGDGINRKSIQQILKNMDKKKLSIDNIAFGMGGALLQQLDRDTLSFAMKASYAVVNGEGRDVLKTPITDSGKSSKAGVLVLNKSDKGFFTRQKWDGVGENHLEMVYRNGKLLRDQTLDEIRELVR